MLKRIPKKRTNASRSQLVRNVRTGETAIYTPDARQPRIPAGWVPLNSGRLNSSSIPNAAELSRYYEVMPFAEAEAYGESYGADDRWLTDLSRELENNRYGRIVGVAFAKPEFEEALENQDLAELLILDDGSFGISMGDGPMSNRTQRFYSYNLRDIEDAVGEF